MVRRSDGSTPSGFLRYRTGSPDPRSATPLYFVGKNPLDHMRVKSAWPLLSCGNCGVSTTNAGRSLFSLPSPYASHDPMLARPGVSLPVITNVHAGSWLIAFVFTVLISAISSTIFDVCGSNCELIQRRHLPSCVNLNFDGATGKRDCPLVIVESRCWLRTLGGSSLSKYSASPGL